MLAGPGARLSVLSLFCRHNRYTTDCPICSKEAAPAGDQAVRSRPQRRPGKGARKRGAEPVSAVRGPFAAAGPYEDGEGRYEVRLERVPGGLRLAGWAGRTLRRRAPRLAAGDVTSLIASGSEKGLLPAELDAAPVPEPAHTAGEFGASPGRSGELRDELRVERLEDGNVRIARWLLRPGSGWELQEAPVMLPAGRFAEALEAAARLGILS